MLTMPINGYNCPGSADFSQVTGEVILPFLFTLDTDNSILDPEEGQNQRFCYVVEGVGNDTSEYADLSHFVLGICSEIEAEEITNISVVIDGESQEIDFGEGGNVELRTEDSPDPTTQCPGLKFEFELSKAGGLMNVCFELTSPYPVGDNPLCLKGTTVVAKGLSICGPACSEEGCLVQGNQRLSACLPVTVTPTADIEETTVQCCGLAVLSTDPCADHTEESCTFYVIQPLCVGVSVSFNAQAEKGEIKVRCDGVSPGTCICQDQ